jgi:hypothetical protein
MVPWYHLTLSKYLIEFEAIFEKGLTRESGAQMGLFDEIIRGRKSRDTVPLSSVKEICCGFGSGSATLLKSKSLLHQTEISEFCLFGSHTDIAIF